MAPSAKTRMPARTTRPMPDGSWRVERVTRTCGTQLVHGRPGGRAGASRRVRGPTSVLREGSGARLALDEACGERGLLGRHSSRSRHGPAPPGLPRGRRSGPVVFAMRITPLPRLASAVSRPSPPATRGARPCDDGAMADLELLDCGGGRRLERFGAVIVDRPAPAADWLPALRPADWAKPTLRWAKSAWIRGARPRSLDGPGRRPHARVPARGRRPGGRLPGARRHVGLARPRGRATSTEASGARPTSCRCSPTRAARRSPAREPARRRRTWTRSKPAVGWARRNAELSGLAERADPLDRRGRPGVRPARAAPRPPLRRDRARPAVVRPRDGRVAHRASTCARSSRTSPRSSGPKPSFVAAQRPHARATTGTTWPRSCASTSACRGHGRGARLRARGPGLTLAARRLGPRPVPLTPADARVDDAPPRRLLTSPKNPRVRAAARPARPARPRRGRADPRRRRARARPGDRRRRAVDEVFVDEHGLDEAGPRRSAHGAVPPARRSSPVTGAVLDRLALRRPVRGASSRRSRIPDLVARPRCDAAGRTRWSSSSRASRSPATSARCCGPPTPRARTP